MSGYVGRGFVELLYLRGEQAVRGLLDEAEEVLTSTPLLWLGLQSPYRGPDDWDFVAPETLRALLWTEGIERLRALDLQDVRFDDEYGEVLLTAGDKLRRVRAYDQLQSEALRERLRGAFGQRLELSPVPEWRSQR
jgi:hypothetical protein